MEGSNRRLHRILSLFLPIVRILKTLGAELSVDMLKLSYARSINGRLHKQCKDLYSEIKGLVEGQSSRLSVNKAFRSQLEDICPLLVNEGIAFASFFGIGSPASKDSTGINYRMLYRSGEVNYSIPPSCWHGRGMLCRCCGRTRAIAL